MRGERTALRQGSLATPLSTMGPGIEGADAKFLEIGNVPGHDLKSMELRGGGNHGV